MTAKRGKDLLVKLDIDGTGNFVTVAGLRSRQIALNAETVDVTDSESGGRWRELLGGAGLRKASISGSGIFKDAQTDDQLRAVFFNAQIANWQIIIPDFGEITGLFQIVALEYFGEHNREVTFDMALESAGEITFGAAQ